MVCLPVYARQLRRVAGAVQRGKRENGTRSRRRSVSASEKRAEGEGERARKNRFTRLPATGVWWASGETSANPGQLGCETAGATTLNGSSMGHGAGRRGREGGEAATLYTDPPPLSSGPSSTPHFQLLHPPPSSSQQEAVDVGVFSWPPLTLFCGRRSLSNLTIGTGTSRRNHHVRQPAPGEPPRRCCLPDSEYGFDGALSLRLFLFWASKFSAPTSSVRVQVAAARLPCPPARFGSVLLSQASGGNGETRPGAWWPWPRPGPGESTWDVHRCPAHCTACDAGGPSEAGRRHEQRDFCVDLTPASPVSKAPTWGRLGPVLLTVLIDRIQLALRLTSLETI